jgi:DNA-binding NarL/FixJ family response regulator
VRKVSGRYNRALKPNSSDQNGVRSSITPLAESWTKPTRVLLVDDHRLFADAIQCSLQEQGVEEVEVATSAAEALEAARRLEPELVVVEINLPNADGIAVGKTILAERPSTKMIGVTASTDAPAMHEAIRAGFVRYLTKDTPLSEFISSVLLGIGGQSLITRGLAPVAAAGISEAEQEVRLLANHLTRREWEVLTMLVQGLQGAEIAERLSVSRNTARSHIQSILTKFQVHSRLEAASLAIRHGLVPPPGGRRFVRHELMESTNDPA